MQLGGGSPETVMAGHQRKSSQLPQRRATHTLPANSTSNAPQGVSFRRLPVSNSKLALLNYSFYLNAHLQQVCTTKYG
jgi:hypothetical protein